MLYDVTMSAPYPGVDISHLDSNVDFAAAIEAGDLDWIGLKATQSVNFTDPTFKERRALAHAKGLKAILIYHFFDPTEDAAAQADYMKSVVGDLQPGEHIVVDVESAKGWDQLTPKQSYQKVYNWTGEVKRVFNLNGTQQILYGSLGWLRGQFGNYLKYLTFMWLWAARYESATLGDISPWKVVLVWQNSEHGTVPGIGKGTVDTDIWMGPMPFDPK